MSNNLHPPIFTVTYTLFPPLLLATVRVQPYPPSTPFVRPHHFPTPVRRGHGFQTIFTGISGSNANDSIDSIVEYVDLAGDM
jgi:hypothetical protein